MKTLKKILCLLLAICTICALCACGGFGNSGTSNQTPNKTSQTIQLTTSNFKNYFFVECETSDFSVNKTGIARGSATCTVSVNQKTAGSLSNVSVTVKVRTYSVHWEDVEKTVTITVPISGFAEKSFSCESDRVLPEYLDEPSFWLEIIDVSGSITID